MCDIFFFVCVCVHMWRPVKSIVCFSLSHLTQVFDTVSLTEPKAQVLARQPVRSYDPVVSTLSVGLTDMCTYAWLLCGYYGFKLRLTCLPNKCSVSLVTVKGAECGKMWVQKRIYIFSFNSEKALLLEQLYFKSESYAVPDPYLLAYLCFFLVMSLSPLPPL